MGKQINYWMEYESFLLLARYVKKIAPYTELVDTRISTRGENYGKEYAYRHKEYVTNACLELVIREGYRLC